VLKTGKEKPVFKGLRWTEVHREELPGGGERERSQDAHKTACKGMTLRGQ